MSQKEAEWYDEMCRKTANARSEPPWCSPWFPIWCRVVDILMAVATPNAKIVELGCGPGAMAEMIHERAPGLKYLGSDFSVVNIQIAQRRGLPGNFHFSVRDLVAEPVTVNDPQNTFVVSVEFLEHIIQDLTVLERLPVGTTVIFTVPDHESEGHERWFVSTDEVAARYASLFDAFEVEPLVIGTRYYFIARGKRAAKKTETAE